MSVSVLKNINQFQIVTDGVVLISTSNIISDQHGADFFGMVLTFSAWC